MSNPRMLYKWGGEHELHGGKFEYVIVEEEDVKQHLEQGWFMTTQEAKDAAEKPAPVKESKPAKKVKDAAEVKDEAIFE